MSRTHRNWKQRTEDNELKRLVDKVLGAKEVNDELEKARDVMRSLVGHRGNGEMADLYHLVNNAALEADKVFTSLAKDLAKKIYPTPPANENAKYLMDLNQIVDDHFGIYMSRPTNETSYITFLPEEKLAEVVPAKYSPGLNEQAREFSNRIIKIATEVGTLDDIDDSLSKEEQEVVVKKRWDTFMAIYQRVYGESVNIELKRCLGLRNDSSPLDKSLGPDIDSLKKVNWKF